MSCASDKDVGLLFSDADPGVLDGLRVARAMMKMSASERQRLVELAEQMADESQKSSSPSN